jgi:superfamily II DNA or RNA helicase
MNLIESVAVIEPIRLWPEQDRLIQDSVEPIQIGLNPILIQAPTGAGKTVIFSEIIRRDVQAGRRALVIAHRREIVRQTVEKLARNGIKAGVIMAEYAMDYAAVVQVASIDTLRARCMGENKKHGLPCADLVVVDEAHHARAKTWARVINHYLDAGATVLGFTATPCRGDGRGLGNIFDALVLAPQVKELIHQYKRLVPTVIYAHPISTKDLAALKISKLTGDYDEAELDALVNKPKLIGNIVEHYIKYGQGRRAICYASSVAHSRNLHEEFSRLVIPSAHIDGETLKQERDQILAKLYTGEIRVVCNYGVLTEGWDCPPVSCCILARPTKSFGLSRQMIGRVLRVHEESSKVNAVILDHANCTGDHGLPEDDVLWTLSEDKRVDVPAHKKRGEGEAGGGLVTCHSCGALRLGGQACGICSAEPRRRQELVSAPDELELRVNGRSHGKYYTEQEKQIWHGMLVAIRNEKNIGRPENGKPLIKPGWVYHKYVDKFGHGPRGHGLPASIEPSHEVRAWVRGKDQEWLIRQRKAQEKVGG